MSGMSMATTVLVVDDDPAIAEAIAQLLNEEGYQVRRAVDGLEALAEIESTHPDVVLSDITLPRMNGIELTRKLQKKGDRTPIVLMSAVYSGVDLPGVRFIPKPFDLDELLHLVDKSIKKSPPKSMSA